MNKNEETIEIYQNITDELYSAWAKLYQAGAGYNLSPCWCKTWLKYFGNSENVKIITIWEQQELKLLAPFYTRMNKLTLIGTKPDLYDEFNILYKDKKYLEKLINYIKSNNYQLNFRHLDSESEFSKELIKYISGNAINQQSHVDETKFFILKDNFNPSGSFKGDVSRCKRNIAKDKDEKYIFEFRTEKTDELINQFIKFHIQRWGGGMLENNSAIVEFLKDILKSDLTVLSKLYLSKTNETAALAIGYLDSNNKYSYSMPTYNAAYSKYSPGKVFLYELINAVFENGINCFDMGRGSEPYKSWVTDQQSILFSIKTNKNPKYYKAQRFVNKILDLIFYY
jgi:hypothetical protein